MQKSFFQLHSVFPNWMAYISKCELIKLFLTCLQTVNHMVLLICIPSLRSQVKKNPTPGLAELLQTGSLCSLEIKGHGIKISLGLSNAAMQVRRRISVLVIYRCITNYSKIQWLRTTFIISQLEIWAQLSLVQGVSSGCNQTVSRAAVSSEGST